MRKIPSLISLTFVPVLGLVVVMTHHFREKMLRLNGDASPRWNCHPLQIALFDPSQGVGERGGGTAVIRGFFT
jgi:hypothetical protein